MPFESTPTLKIAYETGGPSDGFPVLLLLDPLQPFHKTEYIVQVIEFDLHIQSADSRPT